MGKRGPKKRGETLWRPSLRLKPGTASRLQELGVERVSALIEKYAPLWTAAPDLGRPPGQVIFIRPVTPRSAQPVRLVVENRQIRAYYPKDEAFKAVLVRLGFEWQGGPWRRDLPVRAGVMDHRLAEVATRLLDEGFTVQLPDADSAALVNSGDWLPERRRWVLRYGAEVLLLWERGADVVFEATKRLPGGRYDPDVRGVVISPRRYADVLAFAQEFDFQIGAEAHAALEQARSDFENAIVYQPRLKSSEPGPLPSIEEVPSLDHLYLED